MFYHTLWNLFFYYLLFQLTFILINTDNKHDNDFSSFTFSTVFVAVFIRNKAHILPNFLHYLQHMNYPKTKLILW